MSYFEGDASRPRNWKEMSFEFKSMFIHHGLCMAMMMFSEKLTVGIEILASGAFWFVATSMSISRRKPLGWRWLRPTAGKITRAFVSALLGGVFLFAASSRASWLNATILPWGLGVVCLVLFDVLTCLNLVCPSEAEFLSHCRQDEQSVAEPVPRLSMDGPYWHRPARALWSASFMLVWLSGVASFYFSGKAFREGAAAPNGLQIEKLMEKGHVVYITTSEKDWLNLLKIIAQIGIPVVIAAAFFLHFVLGVKLRR